MQIEQVHWTAGKGWQPGAPGNLDNAQLVLVFGATALLKQPQLHELARMYPQALLVGCSTAGEIYDTQVLDDSLVATALRFEHSALRDAAIEICDDLDSNEAGRRLAQKIPHEGLRHVFVLSDGLRVNGSELVKGLASLLPANVTLTGGLAGDGARFQETMVIAGGRARPHMVTLVGLYGERLRVGYGSLGGWDAFGPERLVTRASGNILYELDGKSALALYKTYLGDHASGLPATGLLFPLSLRVAQDATPVVRTILAVDEAEQSMTFAGDLPQGAYVRLMKANFDRLLDGAVGAAKTSSVALQTTSADLAILISCVGRKLILKQRVEEEVEGVRAVLGDRTRLTGFYSYGEISPFTPGAKCELHNQTMTITTFAEV